MMMRLPGTTLVAEENELQHFMRRPFEFKHRQASLSLLLLWRWLFHFFPAARSACH